MIRQCEHLATRITSDPQLADQPIASNNSLWVQLINQAGTPISDKVFFSTYESCTQNLILIDFKQTR